jgi:hypothetical protein
LLIRRIFDVKRHARTSIVGQNHQSPSCSAA